MKGRKLTSFDDVRPGDLLRNQPGSCASMLILTIDSHGSCANITWMLVFDTQKKKELYLSTYSTLFVQDECKIFDVKYPEDYWVKIT